MRRYEIFGPLAEEIISQQRLVNKILAGRCKETRDLPSGLSSGGTVRLSGYGDRFSPLSLWITKLLFGVSIGSIEYNITDLIAKLCDGHFDLVTIVH